MLLLQAWRDCCKLGAIFEGDFEWNKQAIIKHVKVSHSQKLRCRNASAD